MLTINKLITLSVVLTLALTGCSATETQTFTVDKRPEPTVNVIPDPTKTEPSINPEGATGESEEVKVAEASDAAWDEFYLIATLSKDSLLESGAVEYFEMFDEESYALLSVPDYSLGYLWTVYSDLISGYYYISFDAVQMSPIRGYLDIMASQPDIVKAKATTKVSKNEDNTFTVIDVAADKQSTYLIQGGYISGVSISNEEGKFLGYSRALYGSDASLKLRSEEVYKAGVEAGKKFTLSDEQISIASLLRAQ
jgi:hypothetical protein